jgi:hypothetical protein
VAIRAVKSLKCRDLICNVVSETGREFRARQAWQRDIIGPWLHLSVTLQIAIGRRRELL